MRLYVLILVLILATGVAEQGVAGQTSKTSISGPPPYLLGTSTQSVVSASTDDLKRVRLHAEEFVRPELTENYLGKMIAPIGTNSYTADLRLQFYKGQLAVVMIVWSQVTLREASMLRRQLLETYARRLILRDRSAEGTVVALTLRDDAGNQLDLLGLSPSIWLTYLWSPYGALLKKSPSPKSNY